MTRTEFLKLVDDLLELPLGTLKGDEALEELGRWDSMAAVDFLAVVDEHFELALSPQELASCKTVNDLVATVGDKISG